MAVVAQLEGGRMRTRRSVAAIGVALSCLLALTSCSKPENKQRQNSSAATGAVGTSGSAQAARLQPNPDREAYFGEEHIHTSWSVDAWVVGNHLTGPGDACKYAQGETIKHSLGY